MIALAKEVSSSGTQPKAALTEDHAGTGGLGRTRPLVVLQLGQVGSVAIWDELEKMSSRSGTKLKRTQPIMIKPFHIFMLLLQLCFTRVQNYTFYSTAVPNFFGL